MGSGVVSISASFSGPKTSIGWEDFWVVFIARQVKMDIRPYVLSYTRAQDDTLEVRKEVIRWGERALVCGGWILGAVFSWWWLVLIVALIGLYSLVRTVRAAFKLDEFEGIEYRKWSKIDQASLFDSPPMSEGLGEEKY